MKESLSESRDLLVIGAGFGGLSAACTCAREGLDVLLLEAGPRAGGSCRSVTGAGLAWNLSLYSLRGCRPGGPMANLMEGFGLAEEVKFIHSPKAYLVRSGHGDLAIGTDTAAMLESAERLEPGGAGKLERLLNLILDFHPARDFAALSGKTFGEVAAAEGVGGRLLAAFAAPLMISLGVPPGRVSAYFAFMKYHLILGEGLSYPEGGPDHLVGCLEKTFLAAAGTLRCGEKVEAIERDTDGPLRVRTERGREILAKNLVINGDATWAMDLLSPHLPERFRERPRRLTPSLSANLLLLEAPEQSFARFGLDEWPHLVVLGEQDLDALYGDLRSGRGEGAGIFGLTSPSTWEGSRTDGRGLPVTAFFPAAPGTSPDRERLLRCVAGAASGGAADLVLHRVYGPEDLRGLTLGREGAFCGWEMGPERYGRDRLPRRLLPGVYLAGHWTDPGPSILNVLLSGREAARGVLRERGRDNPS